MSDGLGTSVPRPLAGYVVRDYEEAIATLARSRESQGVTFAEMARRMGRCYLQQVYNWLNGGMECRARRLFDLADALGYDLALIPRTEPDEVAPDLEPPPSAATIASVMAIVDAPYQPGLDVQYADAEDLALIPREDTP